MTDWGEPLDDGDETKRTLRELEEDEAKVLDDEIKYVLYELVKEDAETLVLVDKVYRSLLEQRSWLRGQLLRKTRNESMADEALEEAISRALRLTHSWGGNFKPTTAWVLRQASY